MTEWSVYLVLVSLVGFIIAVVAPILKLNTTIVKLSALVEKIAKDLDDLTSRNAATHERIFNELDDHEKRIIKLEFSREEDTR